MKKFVLSLICAAIICSVTTIIVGKKRYLGSALKLLTGIFLSITVLSPVASLPIGNLLDYWEDTQLDAQLAANDGLNQAEDAKAAIIIQKTEAYILETARQLGLSLEASVTLSDSLTPDSVTLHGMATPNEKQRIENIITEQLGISEEKQLWE